MLNIQGLGPISLFKFLRVEKFLMDSKKEDTWNKPYAEYAATHFVVTKSFVGAKDFIKTQATHAGLLLILNRVEEAVRAGRLVNEQASQANAV